VVVRAQSGGRGDRVARGRRGRGHRRRRDELLQDAAGRGRDAPRDPGERRHGRALPRAGRVLDAAAGERGGSGRVGLTAHRDLPEREVVPDLHPQARLDRPATAAPVGATAARVRGRPVRPRSRGGTRWNARAGLDVTHAPRARGSSCRAFWAGAGRAGSPCRGRLWQSLLARRGVLQLALPRLPARLPLLRGVSRRRARGRCRRRPHVQARRLRRVSRRSRRGPRGRLWRAPSRR